MDITASIICRRRRWHSPRSRRGSRPRLLSARPVYPPVDRGEAEGPKLERSGPNPGRVGSAGNRRPDAEGVTARMRRGA